METQLIRRCQGGDPMAFEELFRLYQADVFHFACLVLHDPALAQDVTQEVFLKVFRHVGGFQFRSSFRSWLFRVTMNEAITLLRRRRLQADLDRVPDATLALVAAQPAPPQWEPETAVLARERHRTLWAAVARLDPMHSSVLTLKYRLDFSDAAIARALHCPVGTVKSRLHRARSLLRGGIAVDSR